MTEMGCMFYTFQLKYCYWMCSDSLFYLIFIQTVKLFPHPTFLPARLLVFLWDNSYFLKLYIRFFSSYWSSREICWQVLCLQWSNYMEYWWLKWPESSGTNCKEWQNREVLLLQFPELCWAAAASANFNYHTPAPVPQCHPCWHQSNYWSLYL